MDANAKDSPHDATFLLQLAAENQHQAETLVSTKSLQELVSGDSGVAIKEVTAFEKRATRLRQIANRVSPPLYIWWTDEGAARALGERPDWARYPDVPRYVRREFSSRYGRNGRGRLWVAPGLPSNTIREHSAPSDCAGIVFKAEDLPAVRALPGFITEWIPEETRE